ncbi:MAG: serine hydrolase domain-containing protein [Acidobacteriota bacterium]
MKLSHHRFPLLELVVMLSGIVLLPFSTFAQNHQAETLAAKVDKIFANWDKPTSPGCALGVIKDGQLIYKRGYGMADLDHDIPITSASVFHVASVSKQFTAMAIHLLAKQGKLSLDDEVKKYITELPDFGHKITIRHLLHHTSGLRDQWSLLVMAGWRLSEDVVRDEDILELVSRQKDLNFKPGDQFLYCNTGYTLLAIIVKRVSGKSLREFAAENIFKSLGMNNTFFRDDHAVIVKNQAYGYVPAANNTFKFNVPNYDTVGASSLLTTIEDLVKWDQNFYDYQVGGNDVITQMQTTTTLNNGDKFPYTHGLAVGNYKGLKIVEHSGADAGYRSHLMRFPEQKFSVACLCNLASTNPGMLARQVADVYLADLLKPEAAKPVAEIKGVTLTEEQLKLKIGAYWNPSAEDFAKVTLSNGKLYFAGGTSSELIALSENRFQMKVQPAEVRFEPGADGRLQMIVNIEGRKPILFTQMEAMNPTADELKEYAGAFYSDELDATYRIEIQDGKLFLKRKKYPAASFMTAFKDAFINIQLGTLRFTRDAQKRINGLIIGSGRIRNMRFVKQAQ